MDAGVVALLLIASATFVSFGMGLTHLGTAGGLFAFMATATALVLMWPLGLLFIFAICLIGLAGGGQHSPQN